MKLFKNLVSTADLLCIITDLRLFFGSQALIPERTSSTAFRISIKLSDGQCAILFLVYISYELTEDIAMRTDLMTILINFPICWVIDVFFLFSFILFGVHIVLHDWIHSLHQAEKVVPKSSVSCISHRI